MKSLIWLMLLVAVTFADKCPTPTNVATKQAIIDNLLTFINKPANPPPPVPTVDQAKLKGIGILPKREVFSLFDERQWPEALTIIKRFLTATTFEDFVKTAETIYPRVNEDLFLYCLSVAIVHRPDAQGVRVPRVQDVYPDKFFEDHLLNKMKNKIMAGKKNPILNDTHDFHNHYDIYRRVDYFTEDLGMNAHHYHWHVVHPIFWPENLPTLKKDRSGELFYWMHRQMVARFDSELLSNHLPRVIPFDDWDRPIDIGYASHLAIHRTGYRYMYRPDGLVLQDLPKLTKRQMQQWKLRIMKDITRFNVTTTKKEVIDLRTEDGIDTLANLVISTTNSVNRPFYGNLHSYAHVIASKIADPEGKHHEDSGVMNDVTVSARDPIFYQWHKFLDNIFQTYQSTLRPYNNYELTWPTVSINKISVETKKDEEPNLIHTFWTTNDFKIGKGFGYTLDNEAVIHMRHLDHEDFTYVLDVTNNGQKEKQAVFRVFIIPKYDEHGHVINVNEQRSMAIELDKFTQTLQPGRNIIRHYSNDSSVTMPREQIYDDVHSWNSDDHCHCGWPDYLLLPKGSYEGTTFQLFIMATNWEEDKVSEDTSCHCKNSLSYCGTIYEKYPDRRPMGYPFNRPILSRGWAEFKTQNMYTTDITVKFTGYSH